MPVGCCLPKLLSCPLVCWGAGYPEVHHSSRANLNDEEDEQWSEEQVVDGQEIATPYLAGVVVQESGPGLIGLAA